MLFASWSKGFEMFNVLICYKDNGFEDTAIITVGIRCNPTTTWVDLPLNIEVRLLVPSQ